MKKLLLTFASIVTAMSATSQVTVPYSSDLGIPDQSSTATGSIDPDWIAVDADPGKSTTSGETVTVYTNEWKYARNATITSTGATGGVSLNILAYYNTDDWLISPAISLEAGKTYKISWYSYSSSYAMTYKAMMASNVTDAEFAAMQEENPDLTYAQALDARLDEGTTVGEVTTVKNTIKQSVYTFTPETTGDFRFGFWFNSVKAGGGNLFLTKFEIAEDALTPGVITNFTATPIGTELKVNLNWDLPETDDAGNAITPADISAVKIWRGEELIKTIDGAATSYTDDVPEAGFYSYSVAAVGSKQGATASAETSFVGVKAPYTIPYTADFTDAKMAEAFWTCIDVNEDGKGWKYYNQYGDAYFVFENYSSSITENDWLITPAMAFDKAGTYRMTWTGNCANGKLSFVLGKENTVAAMTGDEAVEIGQTELSTYSAVEKKLDFKITEPGNYYIGIKCDSNPSGGASYYTKGFSVAELAEEDLYLTIAIPEEGSMAFSCKDALDFTDIEGISAYIATLEDNFLSIEKIETVAGSTGVILKGEAGEYKIPYISDAAAPEGNVIKAAVNGQKVSAGAYLYGDGAKGIGFYRSLVSADVPAGGAYLPDTIGDVSFISENGGSTVKLTETITVGEDGSMTYSLNRGLDFTSAQGITAYIIDKVEEGTYSCKEIEKVPASTGILIKAEAGEYEVAYCDDAETVSGNQLRSAAEDTPITAGAFIYKNGDKGMGFYKLEEGMTLTGAAYLPSYASQSEFLTENTGTSTAVSNIDTDANIPEVIYDLNGRKVMNPEKGIYIINGKTVVVK
ncbi:MAG: hypothetical protein K2M39_01510 [Muribaculaceae bacterium]|nr:hypothetical protein [Muribaculaceae bacterium]